MLRKLFLASASVLMLAIAYRVAVPPAQAQSSALVDAGTMFNSNGLWQGSAVASGRTFYVDAVPIAPPIPGTGKVIAVETYVTVTGTSYDYFVMLDTGDMYALPPSHASWIYWGSSVGAGAPTAVRPVSFGALKARYR